MDKNHKILHLEIYGSYELFSCLMASGYFKLIFFFGLSCKIQNSPTTVLGRKAMKQNLKKGRDCKVQ